MPASALRPRWPLLLVALLYGVGGPASAQSCPSIALQQNPCALASAELVASTFGVPVAGVKVEDNLKAMKSMPALTVCRYEVPDGGTVRIGQIDRSTPAAFDARYRSKSDAEIASAMGPATRQAEKATGRVLGQADKATAQSGATELVRGLQFQPVSGLGEKAAVMYSGSSPTAYLITLVKDQTFVVEVRAAKAARERNLALAQPMAAAIAGRCR